MLPGVRGTRVDSVYGTTGIALNFVPSGPAGVGAWSLLMRSSNPTVRAVAVLTPGAWYLIPPASSRQAKSCPPNTSRADDTRQCRGRTPRAFHECRNVAMTFGNTQTKYHGRQAATWPQFDDRSHRRRWPRPVLKAQGRGPALPQICRRPDFWNAAATHAGPNGHVQGTLSCAFAKSTRAKKVGGLPLETTLDGEAGGGNQHRAIDNIFGSRAHPRLVVCHTVRMHATTIVTACLGASLQHRDGA